MENNKKTRSPKAFNINWVYAIFFVFLIAMFFTNQSADTKAVSWLQFERDILSQHDVEKIVVVNKETAEIYIKQNRLDDEKYKDVPKNFITGKTGPQYEIEIGSVESFENKLENAQKDFKPEEKIEVTFETRTSWVN